MSSREEGFSIDDSPIPPRAITDPRFQNAQKTRMSHRPPDDSHLTRILWMPTFDIDLRFMSGSSFLGSFESHKGAGDEKIKKRGLFFFRDGEAVSYGPKEIPALVVNEESEIQQSYLPSPEVIDQMGIKSPNDPSLKNCRVIRNSPRFCANTLLRQYHRVGLQGFDHLHDREEDAKLYYTVILPRNAILVTQRTRLNQTFTGPFLDEVRDYLKKQSGQNVTSFKWGNRPGARDDCRKMLNMMIAGAEVAWAYQNSILNKTEQLIREKRNGGEGKQWYDEPDLRFENPWPSQDAVFLADTNRQPLDMQELEAANKMSENTSKGIVTGLESMMERVFAKAAPVSPTSDPRVGMLESKLDELIALAKARPDLAVELGAQAQNIKTQFEAIGAESEITSGEAPKTEENVA